MKVLANPQSGSYQGLTASRNRYGQYIRTRAIPVNPDTISQQLVRQRFAALVTAAASLSDADITGWKDWADAHPRTDSLGQSIVITWQQAFIGVNQRNQSAYPSTTITTAPPPVPIAQAVASGFTAGPGAAAGELLVTGSVAVTGISASEWSYQIWVSDVVSQPTGFPGKFRLRGTEPLVADLTPEAVSYTIPGLAPGRGYLVRIDIVWQGQVIQSITVPGTSYA